MTIKVLQFKSVLPTDLLYRIQFINVSFVGTILPDVLKLGMYRLNLLRRRFWLFSGSLRHGKSFTLTWETPSEVSGVTELRVDSCKTL